MNNKSLMQKQSEIVIDHQEDELKDILKVLHENVYPISKKIVRIAHYNILDRKGSGAYGEVYRGYDTLEKKQVAIKIIDYQAIDKKQKNPEIRQKLRSLFDTEEILMMQCRSPFLLKCYETYKNQYVKIFILQYCNMGGLDELIQKKGAIAEEDAIQILKQIVLGLIVMYILLKELHKNKIIHRDLKPENILIHNGIFKIADFGFSKKLQKEEEIGNHTFLGSRSTMAPQVSSKKPYGMKADIWSIGIIYFVMIAQSIPLLHRYTYAQNQGKNNKIQFNVKNGNKMSQQSRSFLNGVLQENYTKRLSWIQLKNHQIFKATSNITISKICLLQEQNFNINQETNTVHVELQFSDQEDYFEKIIQEKIQERKITQTKHFKITEVQRSQEICKQIQAVSRIHSVQIIEVSKIQLFRDTLSNFENYMGMKQFSVEELFVKIREYNLQCRKAQYITYKIIKRFVDYKQINENDRKHKEFLYLISFRAYYNVSRAQLFYQKNNHPILQPHKKDILDLYKDVKNNSLKYSKDLIDMQNKVSSKMKDIWTSITDKQFLQQKNKFLTGLEGNQSNTLADFNKQEQIQFTSKYYIPYLIQSINNHHMKERLKAYQEINFVTVKQLQDQEENDIQKYFLAIQKKYRQPEIAKC